jgi:hypothetical protein
MMSPEDFITHPKTWPVRAQVLGCLVFSATVSLGFAFIPWEQAFSHLVYGISFLINGIFARPTAVLWILFTAACTGICLMHKKIWQPKGDFFFGAFICTMVAAFVLGVAFLPFSSSAQHHVSILEDVEDIINTRDTYYVDEIRRWSHTQDKDDTQWVGVNMNYRECAAFLDKVHEKRSFDALNLYVNDKRANYASGNTPRQSCSKVMDNRIEQMIIYKPETQTTRAYYALTTS